MIEEERNNVAHVMHVLFCCYRTYATPSELFLQLRDISTSSAESLKQFNYLLHYWLNNYPDDFFSLPIGNGTTSKMEAGVASRASNDTFIKYEDYGQASSMNKRVIDLLLSLNSIDDALFRRAAQLSADYKPDHAMDANGNPVFTQLVCHVGNVIILGLLEGLVKLCSGTGRALRCAAADCDRPRELLVVESSHIARWPAIEPEGAGHDQELQPPLSSRDSHHSQVTIVSGRQLAHCVGYLTSHLLIAGRTWLRHTGSRLRCNCVA